MRIFFAIELSSKIRRALANLVQHFVCANVQGLRLVELHNIHLTLRFLGNVPLGSVKTIISQMPNELKYIRSFSLFLGRQGTFPVGDEPRVLWVGVKGNLDSLNGLYWRMNEALLGMGFQNPVHKFTPHLTLARMRDRSRSIYRMRAKEILFSANLESGLTLDVKTVSLFHSQLTTDGPKYRRIAIMSLGGVDAGEVMK